MKWMASFAVLMFCTGLFAHGDEIDAGASSSDLKIQNVQPNQNQIKNDNVDDILTNKMMRAQTGSKSKWSISNSINYNGGSLETPLNEHIPNISAGTGLTNYANLTDSISVKYRATTQSSVSAGIGARWISPFNGSEVPQGYNGNKYDAYNPYLRYQYVYRWQGVQNALTAGPTLTTFNNLTRMGYVGNAIVQQNSVYEVGQTGFSVGALAYVIYAAYNNDSIPYRSSISDYSGAFEPFLEYKISPKINLRTFWSALSYEHIVAEPRALTFQQDIVTQSVGVGVSVARDVFLYPNVTFIPYDLRSDRTNVCLSANINLF